MVSGGARTRAGPPVDPTSGRSDARGIRFDALPAQGYDGIAPAFPLPPRTVLRWESDGKARWQVPDEDATSGVADRERELWAWAWRTPQAAAWAKPSESWRLPSIAMWVRTFVLCESAEATAADKNSLHRFADQIGMTPAGLKENGWAVAQDQVAAKRAERSETIEDSAQQPRRRLRKVE